MNVLAAVAVGVLAGMGMLLVTAGVRGNPVLPRPRLRSGSEVDSGRELAWLVASGVAALLVSAITAWLVLAAAAALGVWSSRGLLETRRTDASVVARTEAIAVWTEQVRDNMAAAAGLEQALLASAAHAPAAIAPEIGRFCTRLERMSLLDALGELGRDLDHPSADMVVVALANAVRLEARELGPLLSRLAAFIRADVRMRLRIEVGRARIRTSARIVIATTVATGLFLFVFSPNLLAAYDSFAGQAWLVVVLATFATGMWLLRSFATVTYPARFSARHTAFEPTSSGAAS